jgi:hypothetical protein
MSRYEPLRVYSQKTKLVLPVLPVSPLLLYMNYPVNIKELNNDGPADDHWKKLQASAVPALGAGGIDS